MNSTSLKGHWNEMKGKLKQKYAQLTDDDLLYVEGKENELWGRVQQKIGKTKEEVMRELDDNRKDDVNRELDNSKFKQQP